MTKPNASSGYQRRKCSKCGEGLGFTEGDPCDRCDDPQDGQRHEYSGCGNDDYCIEAAFGEPHCGQPREAEIHLSDDVVDDKFVPFEPAPQQPEPPKRIWAMRGQYWHEPIKGAVEYIALASAEGEMRRQEQGVKITYVNSETGAESERPNAVLAEGHEHEMREALSDGLITQHEFDGQMEIIRTGPAESVAEPAMRAAKRIGRHITQEVAHILPPTARFEDDYSHAAFAAIIKEEMERK